MAVSRPTTPASPKILRPKAQEAGIPLFGCGKITTEFWVWKAVSKGSSAEHLRLLMTKSQDSGTQTIRSYKKLLKVIFDNTPIIAQTSKTPENPPVTSLTPNYLCLQCSATCAAKDRPRHGEVTKHRLCKCGRHICGNIAN
jgi:ubiquitin carboxyl-terminal hydrolase 22/27/51